MPTASFKFTSDFLLESYKRYRKQKRSKPFETAIRLLVLAVLAPVTAYIFSYGLIKIGFFLAGMGVFMFNAHHIDYAITRLSARRSPYHDEDVTIELTDEGFHVRSPRQDTKLQWSVFTRVAHFKDGFLLFQGPRMFNWVPAASLASSAELGELESLLRSKIKEHRIVQPIDALYDAVGR